MATTPARANAVKHFMIASFFFLFSGGRARRGSRQHPGVNLIRAQPRQRDGQDASKEVTMLKGSLLAAAILISITSTAAAAVTGYPTGKRSYKPVSLSSAAAFPAGQKVRIRSIPRAHAFGDGSVRFKVDPQRAGTPIASVTDMVLDPFTPTRRFQSGVVSRFSQGRRW